MNYQEGAGLLSSPGNECLVGQMKQGTFSRLSIVVTFVERLRPKSGQSGTLCKSEL